MDSLDEAMGQWVMRKRISKGLSQSFLASQIQRDQTYVSKIESGVRRLAAVELFELSQALNLKSAELAELFELWCEWRGIRESAIKEELS